MKGNIYYITSPSGEVYNIGPLRLAILLDLVKRNPRVSIEELLNVIDDPHILDYYVRYNNSSNNSLM